MAAVDDGEDGGESADGKKRVGFKEEAEALEASELSDEEGEEGKMSRSTSSNKTQWTERHLNSLVETVHKAQASCCHAQVRAFPIRHPCL